MPWREFGHHILWRQAQGGGERGDLSGSVWENFQALAGTVNSNPHPGASLWLSSAVNLELTA